MCLHIFSYFNDIQSSILITNFFCCGRPCTKSNYTILSKELLLFLKCSTTAQNSKSITLCCLKFQNKASQNLKYTKKELKLFGV